MSDDIMDNDSANEVVNEKTFTQDELEKIVSDRLARERRKFEKKFDGVDVDEARRLLQEKEQAEIERQKERGEFEQVLKKTVEKKEQEIMTYKQKLESTLVDGAVLNSASKNGAVNPEQVASLLKGKIRLADSGSVEVLDNDGTPMYNDKGELLSVDELVGSFLTMNPHFVKATTGGVGSAGSVGGSTPKPQSVAEMVENWTSGGKEAYAKYLSQQK
jgi:hypothetical protein